MRAIWSNTIGEGRPPQKVRSLDDLIAQHMDLDMPAEIIDALRQWLEHVDGDGADWTRLKRMPRTPRSLSRFSSASVTVVSTTTTPRAVAPSLAIVQELSVPLVDGVTTTLRVVPIRF
jgi:hypothetical protein